MQKSRWTILVVVIAVIAVATAKRAHRSSGEREHGLAAHPAQVASAPDATAEPTDAVVSDPGDEPVSSPATPPAAQNPAAKGNPEDPIPTVGQSVSAGTEPSSAAPAGSESPPNPGEPSSEASARGTAVGPVPDGPLPGSKLEECLKNGLPTMADFGVGTCRPCKAMEPILKQATKDYWGKANILFIEMDKYPQLARQYRIAVMPTQIFFDAQGNQMGTHMGFMDRQEIDRRLGELGVEP